MPPADPTATLPRDPAFLQQMILELLAALRDTRRQNEELQHRLDLLLRRLYDPRTERFDPNQPLLIPDAFEPLAPEPQPPATGDADPTRVRAGKSGPGDPQELAWIGTARSCDHGKACRSYSAPSPGTPPGPARSATVAFNLCDWMVRRRQNARAALRSDEDIDPVVRHDSHRRHVGEVADSERKIQALARLWIYFGDYLYPCNIFDFTRSRKRDGLSQFLEGFRGYLQADAFSGYDGIYAGGDVVEVGCNAHARRKFVEAQKTDLARASTALAYSRQLYAIEKEIKAELAKLPEDADEPTRAAIRLRVRQKRAVSVWENLEKWLKKERPQVLSKSPMGGAIGYMENHWEALKR